MYFYDGVLAGEKITFGFRHRETAALYGEDLTPGDMTEKSITIPAEEIAEWQKRWNVTDPAQVEYVLSCYYACDALMHADRFVFHAAAFLWRGKAWLFSAPSGTGKTTQLRNWQRLYGTEMEILNGDKPILELCPDGTVLVHPSPWKGKECLGRDDVTAPLGGIVLLRQDKENRMERITPAAAARELFGRIYAFFTGEAAVLNAARILEGILTVTPAWRLNNLGDEDSTRLTHGTLEKEAG